MDKNSVFYSPEFEYSQDMQRTFDHLLVGFLLANRDHVRFD